MYEVYVYRYDGEVLYVVLLMVKKLTYSATTMLVIIL